MSRKEKEFRQIFQELWFFENLGIFNDKVCWVDYVVRFKIFCQIFPELWPFAKIRAF